MMEGYRGKDSAFFLALRTPTAKGGRTVLRPVWTVLFVLALAFVLPGVYAAEPAEGEEDTSAEENEATTPEDEAAVVVEEKPMTQGELAIIIVRMLGLASEIDENIGTRKLTLRSDNVALAAIDLLRSRGVQPMASQGGWQADKEVAPEVLAVVIVQVLGLLSEVEDPNDPSAYVAALEARGLILTNVREVLSEIEVVNPVVQIIRGSSLPFEDNLSPTRGR